MDQRAAPLDLPALSAWLPLADELIRGLHHSLNNRLAAISSISRIVSADGGAGSGYYDILSDELETLERTLRLLRWLPRCAEPSPEPVRVIDLLPEAVELHRMRAATLDLEFVSIEEEEVPPIRVDSTRFVQAVLVLLGAATRRALDVGSSRVEIRVESRDGSVFVAFDAAPDRAVRAGENGWLPEEGELVATLVGGDGGALVFEEDDRAGRSATIRLRLPSLVLLRRGDG
jgi:hypothetical protein